jgi:hypothetical protein
MSIDSLALENTLWSTLLRFIINLVVLFVLIRVIYYKYSKKEEYLFSFFLMGIIIFLICSLLKTVEIQMGMAIGLFAIFAILRFRTVNYSVKDMTYIFAVIGVSVINSQANLSPPIIGAIVINSVILITTFFLEIFVHRKALTSLIIIYDKPLLLTPNFRQDLLKDLSIHTGQNIEKVKIRKIDINRGNAEVEVFFKDNNINLINTNSERIIN